MNNPGSITKTLSRSSYAVYLIHMIFVFGVIYLSKDIDLPLLAKYLLQVIVITISVWTVAHCLRKVPGLKRIL